MTRPGLIFVGGAPRSGTTLLRAMLDAHPQVAAGPEMRVLPVLAQLATSTRASLGGMFEAHYDLLPTDLDATFRALILSFLEPYRQARGRPVLAEKTPANALHFAELARLFPDAAFLHLIRDGRDVAASLLDVDWKDAATGQPFAYQQDPRAGAAVWVRHIEAARSLQGTGARYIELRYEELVRTPADSISKLMNQLGMELDEAQLVPAAAPTLDRGQAETSASAVRAPVHAQSIGRWRSRLGEANARAAFEGDAAALLMSLGYGWD